MSKTQVRQWFGCFQVSDIQTTTKDNPRSGCPLHRLQFAGQIRGLLAQDHHLTLSQMSTQTGLPRSSVHRHSMGRMGLTSLCTQLTAQTLHLAIFGHSQLSKSSCVVAGSPMSMLSRQISRLCCTAHQRRTLSKLFMICLSGGANVLLLRGKHPLQPRGSTTEHIFRRKPGM